MKQTIDILQSVLATEIVCVLRYTMNAIAATGISSDSVKKEFEEHAKEEQGHMRQVAERINQWAPAPPPQPANLQSCFHCPSPVFCRYVSSNMFLAIPRAGLARATPRRWVSLRIRRIRQPWSPPASG